MTTPQMDWLDDQRRKRAVSSDDIVTRDVTDPWQEICELRDEIERLRAAIDAVRQAVTDAGSHPEHHHEVRRRHEQEWPTLWRAIAGLREARRG